MRPQDGRSSAVEAVFRSPQPSLPRPTLPLLTFSRKAIPLFLPLILGRAEPSTGSSHSWQTCRPGCVFSPWESEQTVPSSEKHPAHSAALIWSFLSPSCTGHQPIPSLPVPALRLPRACNLRPCLSPRSRVSVQPPPSGYEAATCVLLLIPLDHAGHPSGSQP